MGTELERQLEEKRRQDQAETDRLARDAEAARQRRQAEEWR